ncbi:MAG: hypothetical protein ACKVVP_09690 [Chloroflexota bacterium]
MMAASDLAISFRVLWEVDLTIDEQDTRLRHACPRFRSDKLVGMLQERLRHGPGALSVAGGDGRCAAPASDRLDTPAKAPRGPLSPPQMSDQTRPPRDRH